MAVRLGFALRRILSKTHVHDAKNILKRNGSNSAQIESEGKWHLLTGVCVERWPVLTQPKSKIETRFEHLLQTIELENSLLSDHEVRHKSDLLLEARRKQEDYEETDLEASTQTALDAEDLWETEAKQFTPADRITEADRSGDLKSVDRKLEKKLVLLVKQKLGDKSHWVFPQGECTEGETMRKTAERVLASHCGKDLSAQFLGNAPCGFHKYAFKKNPELGPGAKIFFFKASYKTGDVVVNGESVEDYMWVTKQELKNYLNRDYLKSVNPFIIDL